MAASTSCILLNLTLLQEHFTNFKQFQTFGWANQSTVFEVNHLTTCMQKTLDCLTCCLSGAKIYSNEGDNDSVSLLLNSTTRATAANASTDVNANSKDLQQLIWYFYTGKLK